MLAPLMPAAEAEVVADKKATYVNDPEQGRHAYGIEGIKDSDASCMTVARWHNNAYATGFKWMQAIMWTIFVPMSVPFAFVIGLMVS